ncbi:hypothetical protein PR202_ga20551 [Eleusine coracana subsp. coracana]|uniref:Reverse transcriptase zinc-binding domain-containing protein n=1 Tax=Eleusine coracana subsp. coracana TaxID=191504 RepID=A0AAV5CZ17_ELECO|nr:hypothetical protein PR202_ga20551 [Eleusine coracana subsp. coracana]
MSRPTLCLLCDQEEDTINHLLTSCVFARQFWFSLLRRIGLGLLAPQPSDVNFYKWWQAAVSSVDSSRRRGLNSLIILGAWSIWRHRNYYVFNGASPSIGRALVLVGAEACLWSMVGAKGLTFPSDHDPAA